MRKVARKKERGYTKTIQVGLYDFARFSSLKDYKNGRKHMAHPINNFTNKVTRIEKNWQILDWNL